MDVANPPAGGGSQQPPQDEPAGDLDSDGAGSDDPAIDDPINLSGGVCPAASLASLFFGMLGVRRVSGGQRAQAARSN